MLSKWKVGAKSWQWFAVFSGSAELVGGSLVLLLIFENGWEKGPGPFFVSYFKKKVRRWLSGQEYLTYKQGDLSLNLSSHVNSQPWLCP